MRGNEEVVGSYGRTATLQRGPDLGVVERTLVGIREDLHIAEILVESSLILLRTW